MKVVHSQVTFDQLSHLARELISHFTGRDVVLLFGTVGVGKTSFARSLAEELGSCEAISPTFALHNEYPLGNMIVDHLDLYRLQSLEEIESIGFWDLFAKPNGLILVEWAEKLEGVALSKQWKTHKIWIEKDSNDSDLRQFTFQYPP